MSIYTFMQKIAQGTKPQKKLPQGKVYDEGINPNNLDDNTKRMIERLRSNLASNVGRLTNSSDSDVFSDYGIGDIRKKLTGAGSSNSGSTKSIPFNRYRHPRP